MRELALLNTEDIALSQNLRDTSRPIILIGFQEQENLGLGYLAATLRSHGYHVVILDFATPAETILDCTTSLRPLVIGFSLIFQFYLPQFATLIRYLRQNGIHCHFTIGGHFPSLSHAKTLELIPELDSVVRFEGEDTLLELVDHLGTERSWQEIKGIAYRQNDIVISNQLRPLVDDLDRLPYPVREVEPRWVLGKKVMPILASRGCSRTCSFCSIHTFYRGAPGKIVRLRKPSSVVAEMKYLQDTSGISIFLFQDDDFPLFGPSWRRWVMTFVDELYRQGVADKAIWKISCRADTVEPELFTTLRNAGLYLVYMGLESGSDEGLDTLNKEITVEQNLHAVNVLKSIGLNFQYGFMLFDPSSSFESVKDNIKFLRQILKDGSAPATFCRMVPYDGTPIKDELAKAGRLRGDVCNPDYDFLDPRLEDFFQALHNIVHVAGWIHGCGALSPQLTTAWNEIAVLDRLFPAISSLERYRAKLRTITHASNDLLFSLVENMAESFQRGDIREWSGEELESRCNAFREDLLTQRDAFVYENQEFLLEALEETSATASHSVA
jgi:anaerobic magnesium-protoporphyrin IX monomethyl ester cyclase